MFFNSYSFVLLFLPAVTAGYFLFNRLGDSWGKGVLLAASLLFYGLFDVRCLPVLLGSILGNYGLAAWMRRLTGRKKRVLFLCGAGANLLALLFFKYTDFFLKNVHEVTGFGPSGLSLIVPVGLSFYTFQQLSFLTDSYHDPKLSYPILDYGVFVSFFPYVISGPIALHSQMIPQLQDHSRKTFNEKSFARGLCSFSLGLAKKTLIADAIAPGADWAFSNVVSLNAPEAWLGMLSYTLQLYFDFSGYSDMARGVGQMLNLDIPVNFNSPYRALSVTDFWKRWHMTLTAFFTRYVYIPLGGNRKGKGRTYGNVMLVFLLSGFWHGANWTFLLWGLLHGLGSVFCRVFHGKIRLPKPLRWLITFLFVNCTWVIFRASSVLDALRLYKRLLFGGWGPVSPEFSQCFLFEPVKGLCDIFSFPADTVAFWVMLALLAFGCWASIRWKNTQERLDSSSFGWKLSLACGILLAFSVLSFSGVTSFIYVNF